MDSATSFVISRVGADCYKQHFIWDSVVYETTPYRFLDGRSGETDVIVTYFFYPLPDSETEGQIRGTVEVFMEGVNPIVADGMYDLRNAGWCNYQLDRKQAMEIILAKASKYGYEAQEVASSGITLSFSLQHFKWTWKFSSCEQNKTLEIDPADGTELGYYDEVICGGIP